MSNESEHGKRPHDRRDRGLFERPPGSGIWWVRYHDEHGGEHREKVGPKGLARKVYQKRKTEVAERRFFPERLRQREYLFADTVDDYLRRIKGRLRSYKECERHAKTWKSVLSGKTLRQITPGDIERHASARVVHAAPATVNRELAFLKRVFTVAMDDGRVELNPVRAITFFKENNARTRFLSKKEVARLRLKLGENHWPLVELALNTGLRQGEQFNLKWEDIDFTVGIITIPRAKSGEVRRVPMNDAVRRVLAAQPSRFRNPYVFPSQSGKAPRDAHNYMTNVFRPALQAAQIDDFRWHDLRQRSQAGSSWRASIYVLFKSCSVINPST